MHYLAHTVEEWQYYWDIASPAFKLSFTANHAHLVPEGIAGFVAALDFSRVGEVRLADCFRNGHEVHLPPGQGDLDFGAMFKLIEGRGFRGNYTKPSARWTTCWRRATHRLPGPQQRAYAHDRHYPHLLPPPSN